MKFKKKTRKISRLDNRKEWKSNHRKVVKITQNEQNKGNEFKKLRLVLSYLRQYQCTILMLLGSQEKKRETKGRELVLKK